MIANTGMETVCWKHRSTCLFTSADPLCSHRNWANILSSKVIPEHPHITYKHDTRVTELKWCRQLKPQRPLGAGSITYKNKINLIYPQQRLLLEVHEEKKNRDDLTFAVVSGTHGSTRHVCVVGVNLLGVFPCHGSFQ